MKQALFSIIEVFPGLLTAVLLTACGSTISAPPVSHGVPFPANYKIDFVRYATVDHKDAVVRDLYISPTALEQVRAGYALPEGTIIVVEGYEAKRDADGQPMRDASGRFIKGEMKPEIHIAEKRSTWQAEDFESGQLSDDWNFGSYVASGEHFDEPLTPCFNCHNTTERSDFIWSLPMLWRYQRSGGQVQYEYCNASGRSPCDL
ncbi:MAG TPA: cytochrome P460 family protein [Phototrophicaceae bacterium]|nr:cytochrome P460 family protein [Phototrophicaceae bacterium]